MDDSFEQFLKQAADSFRMYPNQKVWHSIYNNIHPSRKWPSLSVLLLLICSVMYIGINNTASVKYNGDPAYLETAKRSFATLTPFYEATNESASITYLAENSNHSESIKPTTNSSSESTQTFPSNFNRHQTLNNSTHIQITIPDIVYESRDASANQTYQSGNTQSDIAKNERLVEKENRLGIKGSDKKLMLRTNHKDVEFEFDQPQLLKKKKAALSYHVYATPSFGYRSLKNNANFPGEEYLSASLIADPDQEIPPLNHNPAVNIEIGGGIYYPINKRIRLKAGVQVNLTNYKVNAIGLNHPVTATYLLNGAQPNNPQIISQQTYISNIGNGELLQLNSSTFQFVLPVGADIKVAGNKNIAWYAGFTLQPGYVAGGNAYIISTNQKSYISDATILRSFNLSGGLETFITYQPIDGLNLNIGPQLRYQFLSTYKSNYPIKEHLYNIGVKIGVTTRF